MAGLPWKTKTKMKTMLVLIISVCTVSVSYANGRGDPEGISMGKIMPCMHHQLAAAPRGCCHGKPACRFHFHLTARRLQPTARPSSHHPPARSSLSLSTSSSEAIPLSLSLHLSPILFFIPLSHQREGSDQIGCFFLVLVEV